MQALHIYVNLFFDLTNDTILKRLSTFDLSTRREKYIGTFFSDNEELAVFQNYARTLDNHVVPLFLGSGLCVGVTFCTC